MAIRQIIEINEGKCNGCGLCANGCPEGAIRVIDGKARLVGEVLCDGLGACIGVCPENAITIVEREAEEYDEKKVMKNIMVHGKNTIIAHLKHLVSHNQTEYFRQAEAILAENNIDISKDELNMDKGNFSRSGGCPGSKAMTIEKNENHSANNSAGKRRSELTNWPIQLHLVSPAAPYFRNKSVLLAADCTGYCLGDFHKDHMKNKSVVIACPKLDRDRESYVKKITGMIEDAGITELTVMIMQVPCCSGLVQIAREALNNSKRKIQIKVIVVSISGEILKEDCLSELINTNL